MIISDDSQEQTGKIRVQVDAEIADLIPEFFEIVRQDLGGIPEALRRDDFGAIRIVAHSLKGSGGGYGFDAISEMAAALEEGAKAQDTEEIERWSEEISTYLERVEIVHE